MTDLIYEVREKIGRITINRPERRNALSMEAVEAFLSALDEAEGDIG